jgi:hypothetical protein
LKQCLGPTQEALAVLKAFATRIQAPIDDVHSHPCIRLLSRLASRACTIRRAGEPDARYNHVHALDKTNFIGLVILRNSMQSDPRRRIE